MGGVSLKNRRCSVDFYSLEVMISNVLLLTCLRPKWRGVANRGGLDIHLGRKVVNYWVSAFVEMWYSSRVEVCRQEGADRHGETVQNVAGVMRRGRLR